MAMEVIHLIPEGVQTYGNHVLGYVKDNVLYLNTPELKIMIEDEDQIEELAEQLPPGTEFFVPGEKGSWTIGADGTASKNDNTIGTFYVNPEDMNLYYNPEVE